MQSISKFPFGFASAFHSQKMSEQRRRMGNDGVWSVVRWSRWVRRGTRGCLVVVQFGDGESDKVPMQEEVQLRSAEDAGEENPRKYNGESLDSLELTPEDVLTSASKLPSS